MNNEQWLAESGRADELAAWEAAGRPIPSPPVAKQALVRRYAERWGVTTLVETGTYIGEMVVATNDLFEKVYTIELSPTLYEQAGRTFCDHANVFCLQGDSTEVLPRILDGRDHRALLWLDGHFSQGTTALGPKETPIVAELETALGRPERHVILIDDARCFADGAEPHPDYPTIAWVERTARAHGYEFALADDVMRLEPTIARPSFSVLMPTRDRHEFLSRAVEAVLAQERVDLQLIVKNGGDDIGHLLPTDPRLVYVCAPDVGIPDAMNQALAFAEGDVVHWANDDDVMASGALEFVATWLDDAEWGFGRMRMVDPTGRLIALAGGGSWDPVRNLQANGVPQPACYWRAGLGVQVGPWDVNVGVCADFDYEVRLGQIAVPKITERVLADYTVHPDSFTVRDPGALARSAAAVRRKHRDSRL